jgi:hypothetical protein
MARRTKIVVTVEIQRFRDAVRLAEEAFRAFGQALDMSAVEYDHEAWDRAENEGWPTHGQH